MRDLLDVLPTTLRVEPLAPGAVLLGGFAVGESAGLVGEIGRIAAHAPFRNLQTPGGRTMSVAMTNCGRFGWVSDKRGYRYEAIDPMTGNRWPAMPDAFATLAQRAAAAAGYVGFAPDCCLVNRYEVGSALSLHSDHDEQDRHAPIVSVSLGLPAVFLWGGIARADRARRLALRSGDVVVWGGPARFVHHGVARIAPCIAGGADPLGLGLRLNLTFRRTGLAASLAA